MLAGARFKKCSKVSPSIKISLNNLLSASGGYQLPQALL